MRVEKQLRYQHEDFGSKSFLVALTHEEAGLPTPSSAEECRQVVAELSMVTESLMLIEEVKLGRIHANQISEKLRPWVLVAENNHASTPTTDQV